MNNKSLKLLQIYKNFNLIQLINNFHKDKKEKIRTIKKQIVLIIKINCKQNIVEEQI
jgi:hypothetical protein